MVFLVGLWYLSRRRSARSKSRLASEINAITGITNGHLSLFDEDPFKLRAGNSTEAGQVIRVGEAKEVKAKKDEKPDVIKVEKALPPPPPDSDRRPTFDDAPIAGPSRLKDPVPSPDHLLPEIQAPKLPNGDSIDDIDCDDDSEREDDNQLAATTKKKGTRRRKRGKKNKSNNSKDIGEEAGTSAEGKSEWEELKKDEIAAAAAAVPPPPVLNAPSMSVTVSPSLKQSMPSSLIVSEEVLGALFGLQFFLEAMLTKVQRLRITGYSCVSWVSSRQSGRCEALTARLRHCRLARS